MLHTDSTDLTLAPVRLSISAFSFQLFYLFLFFTPGSTDSSS